MFPLQNFARKELIFVDSIMAEKIPEIPALRE